MIPIQLLVGEEVLIPLTLEVKLTLKKMAKKEKPFYRTLVYDVKGLTEAQIRAYDDVAGHFLLPSTVGTRREIEVTYQGVGPAAVSIMRPVEAGTLVVAYRGKQQQLKLKKSGKIQISYRNAQNVISHVHTIQYDGNGASFQISKGGNTLNLNPANRQVVAGSNTLGEFLYLKPRGL